MPLDSSLVQFSPAILAVVPLVMGFTQFIKTSNYVKPRFVPIICLILSVGGAFLVTDVSWQQTLIQGISVGLLSIGVFSSARSTVQG